MRIELVTADHPNRAAVEDGIRRIYTTVYGAAIPAFAPLLITGSDARDKLLCAAGLRFAPHVPFSQIYLDRPVEAAVAAAVGEPVAGGTLIEVSSLAAFVPGTCLALIAAIMAEGRQRGARWAVFTATRLLRRLLERNGLPLVDLGPARPERVAQAEVWGSYYDHDPHVVAVRDMPQFRAATAGQRRA